MKSKHFISMSIIAAVFTACDGGGGVDLNPTVSTQNSNNPTTNITNTSPTTPTNPCASYTVSGQTIQGTYDGTNCTYSNIFVSDTSPLTTDVVISELENDGLHIFEDSLWMGQDVNANAAAQGVRVPQDGEGPSLTIGAGSKIAFSNSADYLRIARGSRIIAEGTKDKPIIISSVNDLRDSNADEDNRGDWGGVQINGNGLTNKCTDAERQPTGNNPHGCHVGAEGRPGTYGGNNNTESSGVLRYVQIRYAGFEVVDGNELNGLTLNGVGSGTVIEFVQIYTTLDDGFEMFGGAVDLKNTIALNIGDDSYDYSQGWVGNIQFALATAISGSNRCIEADNTGSSDPDDIAPFTKGRVSNMTCITSNVDSGDGTAPTTKGDSEGPLYREGSYIELYNSIITSNASGQASNECVEVTSSQTIASLTNGISRASGNVVACSEALKGTGADAFWAAGGNVAVTGAQLPANLITGLGPSNPTAYVTASSLTDGSGAPINVTIFDVTALEDDFDAASPPAIGSSGDSSFFEAVDFIGAVKSSNPTDDWVAGWTIGLE